MTTPRGVKRAESGYLTHNYCSHCTKWIEHKPKYCPDCNRCARTSSKYVKHKVVNRIG